MWYIQSSLCYHDWNEIAYSMFNALPAIVYVTLVQPHDCFECLSVQPELRITDFQLNPEEHLRRAYFLKYGGLCNCFPTCGRRMRFRKMESFERKVRKSSLRSLSGLSPNMSNRGDDEQKESFFTRSSTNAPLIRRQTTLNREQKLISRSATEYDAAINNSLNSVQSNLDSSDYQRLSAQYDS